MFDGSLLLQRWNFVSIVWTSPPGAPKSKVDSNGRPTHQYSQWVVLTDRDNFLELHWNSPRLRIVFFWGGRLLAIGIYIPVCWHFHHCSSVRKDTKGPQTTNLYAVETDWKHWQPQTCPPFPRYATANWLYSLVIFLVFRWWIGLDAVCAYNERF
jgi:hypothetical protein